MKIGSAVRPGRVPEKKGQDRTVKKKSQSGNISPIWGEVPTVPIRTKICMVGSLLDVIMCAKFQVEIFRGYDFTEGRISHFPIDFPNALPVIEVSSYLWSKLRYLEQEDCLFSLLMNRKYLALKQRSDKSF